MPKKPSSATQSDANLYRAVRAGLIVKGTSLNAWAQANGRHESNVRAALKGLWKGPKAKKLVKRIAADAGVSLQEVA